MTVLTKKLWLSEKKKSRYFVPGFFFVSIIVIIKQLVMNCNASLLVLVFVCFSVEFLFHTPGQQWKRISIPNRMSYGIADLLSFRWEKVLIFICFQRRRGDG